MIIAPSILTADFCELGKVLDEAVDAGINWFHLDVMDGNWVTNKTITVGPAVIKSIRKRFGTKVFMDCHLMITNAEKTWQQYVDAGVDLVIAHVEAVSDFSKLCDSLHSANVQAGLVFNPATSVNEVLPHLNKLDLVLVMSVVPGKGGQSFMPEVEEKIRILRSAIDEQISEGGIKTRIMIDGGIKAHNIAMVKEWGVEVAVVGSGLINNNASISENLAEIELALK
ncbi:MAG: ribulose-phosphate 3-epimerase [Euryarchaeota archaeon]|nr:ribulose-phosphate 3-epimerase [Euryarchaeota archaeon]MBT3971855.1 ribulose-phosphate 3-epimerase [Euryarchaeota archaeon]MBT4407777.1 ribulose-phosphate 3-epimerase [Euryarchaeota archaeon]MBT6644758.1 ribulose-phosphate 3-epimerase [Euryarchaeota archaeon]